MSTGSQPQVALDWLPMTRLSWHLDQFSREASELCGLTIVFPPWDTVNKQVPLPCVAHMDSILSSVDPEHNWGMFLELRALLAWTTARVVAA